MPPSTHASEFPAETSTPKDGKYFVRGSRMYIEKIRAIVAKHAQLSEKVENLTEDRDLYAAGLSSLSTVNLMLALEDHFDVEFKDSMLGRKTFSSLRSLSEAIEELHSSQLVSK